MQRRRFITCLVAIAAATPAVGVDRRPALPNRAELAAALDAWTACPTEDGQCGPSPYRRVTSWHCRPLPEDVHPPGRVLCRFSGRSAPGPAAARRFRNDCACLRRDTRGAWIVEAFPDADLCD